MKRIPVGVFSLLLLVSSSCSGFSMESSAKNLGKVAATIVGASCWSLLPVVLVFSPASNAASAANLEEGQKVFEANCVACHRGGQNMIEPEKSLEKQALEQYLAGGRSEESVIKQVSGGKNSMPAFGGRLADESIVDVAAYVIKSAEDGWN